MSSTRNHVSGTLRPRLGSRTSAVFCLLAFALTAAAVHRLGHGRPTPAETKTAFAATAYVVEPSATPTAEEVRIPISYTADDPQRAEEVANMLADRYVDDRRVEWERRTEGVHRRILEAAGRAREEYAQSESLLETFRRQLADVAKAAQAGDASQASTIDNPEWIALEEQIAELQQRREQLLADRTPLHPAVQDVSGRIDDLQRERDAVPRQVPGPASAPSQAVEFRNKGPQLDDAERARLNELTTAVDEARRRCEETTRVEQESVRARQTGPRYSAIYAEAAADRPMAEPESNRLAWTTLAASVLMACGVGLVFASRRCDPCVASEAHVRTDSHVAVIGVIPADDPVADPLALYERQSKARRALTAVGAILIVAAPAAAAWGLIGF